MPYDNVSNIFGVDKYYFRVEVERVVRDTMLVALDASNLFFAETLARSAAETYPAGTSDVSSMYVENRESVTDRATSVERMVAINNENS